MSCEIVFRLDFTGVKVLSHSFLMCGFTESCFDVSPVSLLFSLRAGLRFLGVSLFCSQTPPVRNSHSGGCQPFMSSSTFCGVFHFGRVSDFIFSNASGGVLNFHILAFCETFPHSSRVSVLWTSPADYEKLYFRPAFTGVSFLGVDYSMPSNASCKPLSHWC